MCQKCQLCVLPCHHYVVIYRHWEIVLGHLHLFPYRAILVKISSKLSLAPCFLLIALLMSGRFLGVSLMDTHHFNVFQWNLLMS